LPISIARTAPWILAAARRQPVSPCDSLLIGRVYRTGPRFFFFFFPLNSAPVLGSGDTSLLALQFYLSVPAGLDWKVAVVGDASGGGGDGLVKNSFLPES
jgi:hypothetical protein